MGTVHKGEGWLQEKKGGNTEVKRTGDPQFSRSCSSFQPGLCRERRGLGDGGGAGGVKVYCSPSRVQTLTWAT